MKFCEFLALRGINKKNCSIIQYRLKKIRAFSEKQVVGYLMWVMNNRTKSTFNRYIYCFRIYAEYLIAEKKKAKKELSWLYKIKRVKEEPAQRVLFSAHEIEKFLQVKDRYSHYFSLLARTGARPMEIASLKKADIDFANNILKIQRSKTGEGRCIPIPEELLDSFYQYLQSHNSTWCFPIKNHLEHHITWESMNKAFRKRGQKLNLNSLLTPYSFRHTFITRMLGAGVPLFVVQQIVGHKKADTTQKYFHLSFDLLKEGMKKDPLIWNTLSSREKIKDVDEYISALGLDNHKDFSYTRSNDKIILQIINN